MNSHTEVIATHTDTKWTLKVGGLTFEGKTSDQLLANAISHFGKETAYSQAIRAEVERVLKLENQ